MIRGRPYPKIRRFVESSQWWSPDQILAFQWQEVKKLLAYAFGNVPYYQKKYHEYGIELGDIRTRDDFARLPPLTRDEINNHLEEMSPNPRRAARSLHSTGGSSGVPLRFYWDITSYDWRCAVSDRAYSYSGWRLGERTLYLWGAPVGELAARKKAELRLHRAYRRQLMINTFIQSEQLWDSAFAQARQFRPKFLVGYVGSIEAFCRFLLDRNLSLAGVRGVLGAAEGVNERTRQLAQEALHAPVFDAYGSREFMSVAAECEEHNGLHINAENVLLETELPPQDGPSEILITDLHNCATPLIRYRIGDLGALSPAACPCGRGLPQLAAIEGRVVDALRAKDGRLISGLVFPHIVKEVAEIKEFQARQQSFDCIELAVVLKESLSPASEDLLQREFKKIFGEIRVKITPVDQIPRLPSGKHRPTVGLSNQPASSSLPG